MMERQDRPQGCSMAGTLCWRKRLTSQCAPGRGMVAVDRVGGEGLMAAAVGTAV